MGHEETATSSPTTESNVVSGRLIAIISLLTAAVYYFSNPKPHTHYDYTFRVALNFLSGSVGFVEKQPQWLNEFVPFEGFWYSVFPLGAVVSMLPFAVLKQGGNITQMPSAFIAALCAGVSCLFLLLTARRYDISRTRTILMPLGILFGTFAWANITMGGAWQLALGFALVGILGAIYFTVYKSRPLIAGAFFALAFGNRTEILLTAPIFMYLLWRGERESKNGGVEEAEARGVDRVKIRDPRSAFRNIVLFCIVPVMLGVLTLVYNYVRFHSFSDFGYARIPGVLNEPWYTHGIFSVYYIPGQIWEMLLRMWEWRPANPFPTPNPFSSSILISSPFLLYAFRKGGRDKILKYLCWAAVLIICIVLWMHGNSGGWQFGYRYAIAILPFLFVIMLETSPQKVKPLEWAAYGVAFILNAYATWLFHWTVYLKP